MPDADDVDFEDLRRMIRGEAPQEKPAPAPAKPRKAAAAKAVAPRKAQPAAKAKPTKPPKKRPAR